MLIQPSLDSVNIGATAKIEAFARSKHDPKAGKRGGDAWCMEENEFTCTNASQTDVMQRDINLLMHFAMLSLELMRLMLSRSTIIK